ncbi:hypothetical protein N7527_003301 [Penicillium freii]|uniref:Uncharacterized protein n=1 Tax=Penicillium freii TaxID=48697 RepID=A0A101MRG0_PENFR|nr:hypothetical protein N7527_003301 [Penicillium freii]KUM65351.1 hypothetical protein ACN42_g1733 [Penicillium freii]
MDIWSTFGIFALFSILTRTALSAGNSPWVYLRFTVVGYIRLLGNLKGDDDNHGDFKSENVNFAWQHDARIHNETDESLVLSLYNNAAMDHSDPGPSTGLVIHVDLVNKKAWRIQELTDPTDHIVSATQGSFQFLPNSGTEHMLLGYGSIPKLKEYDGDGNVVLRGQFGKDTFSANAYRIFKFPWSATPHWDPALFVNHTTSHMTDLYMS